MEDLIQTAIDQAKSLPRSVVLWDRVFGPGPTEQLMSTLEEVRTAVSGTDSVVMRAPFAASRMDVPKDIDTIENAT